LSRRVPSGTTITPLNVAQLQQQMFQSSSPIILCNNPAIAPQLKLAIHTIFDTLSQRSFYNIFAPMGIVKLDNTVVDSFDMIIPVINIYREIIQELERNLGSNLNYTHLCARILNDFVTQSSRSDYLSLNNIFAILSSFTILSGADTTNFDNITSIIIGLALSIVLNTPTYFDGINIITSASPLFLSDSTTVSSTPMTFRAAFTGKSKISANASGQISQSSFVNNNQNTNVLLTQFLSTQPVAETTSTATATTSKSEFLNTFSISNSSCKTIPSNKLNLRPKFA